MCLCICRGSISGTVDSFQSRHAFTGQRALTIVSLLMSGCGRGHMNLERHLMEENLAKLPVLDYSRSGNTDHKS